MSNDLDDTSTETGTDIPTGARTETRGFHALGTAHLVMGVVLLALAALWALLTSGVAGSADLRWLLPLPFVLGGAVGLVALGLSARRGGAAA